MKKNKKIVAILAMATLTSVALFAQAAAPATPTTAERTEKAPVVETKKIYPQSNTNGATAGVIKTDVDYSMDPRYYHDANVNNFLVYTKIDDFINLLDITEPSFLEAGFAKQFSNIYFGTLYTGNLWGQINKITATKDGENVTNAVTEASCENNLAVLVGFLNMGVRVDLNFAPTILTREDTALVVEKDRNVPSETKVPKMTDTSLRATWGGSFDFKPFSLKPYAYVGNHYVASKDIANAKNENNPGVYVQNLIEAGLGADFAFNFTDCLSSVAGLKYDFGFGAKKILDEHNVEQEKEDIMTNKVDVFYDINYTVNDIFEIGGKVDVDLAIMGEAMNLTPTIGFGASWEILASTLGLNLGVDVSLPDLITNIAQSSIDFKSTFYSGLRFNLGEHAVIDAMIDIPIAETKDGNVFNKISIGASFRR